MPRHQKAVQGLSLESFSKYETLHTFYGGFYEENDVARSIRPRTHGFDDGPDLVIAR